MKYLAFLLICFSMTCTELSLANQVTRSQLTQSLKRKVQETKKVSELYVIVAQALREISQKKLADQMSGVQLDEAYDKGVSHVFYSEMDEMGVNSNVLIGLKNSREKAKYFYNNLYNEKSKAKLWKDLNKLGLKKAKRKILKAIDGQNLIAMERGNKEQKRSIAFIGELAAWLLFGLIFTLIGLLIFGGLKLVLSAITGRKV